MIRILYIVSNFRRTGPTRQLLNIISGLDRNKCAVNILSLSPEPENTMIDDFRKLSVNISSLALSRMKGILLSNQRLKSNLQQIKPDIIHSQGIRPDILAAGIRDVPVVASIRNDPFVDYPSKFGKVAGNLMALQHVRIIRKIQAPVACSISLSDAFKLKYRVKMPAIQNGVDIDKYTVAGKAEKAVLRKKLDLNPDKSYFITVGSLIPRKNTGSIIESFKKNPSANLILLGDGPERNQLQTLSSGFENIKFYGNVSNAGEYLKAADYFISASNGEGLPNTVMEAISTGLPVLLSDIEPHREIINDPSYPFFFPPEDSASIANQINGIQLENYERLQQRMRNIAENKFSAKFMAHNYQELYFKLLS